MPTTKEKLKEMLTSRGMFDNDADKVLDDVIPQIDAYATGYNITWDRPASEYPDVLYGVMWVPLQEAALKWIDSNAPQAWFRPMFL